jgi:hypothetical protein
MRLLLFRPRRNGIVARPNIVFEQEDDFLNLPSEMQQWSNIAF